MLICNCVVLHQSSQQLNDGADPEWRPFRMNLEEGMEHHKQRSVHRVYVWGGGGAGKVLVEEEGVW